MNLNIKLIVKLMMIFLILKKNIVIILKKKDLKDFIKSMTFLLLKKKKIQREFNTPHVTNAWIKFQELIVKYDLVDKNAKKFIYFDNAAFPGAFIYSMNHYINTKTKIKDFIWYGSSLLGEEDIALQDSYLLYQRFPKKWIMNEKNNGDVTNINNILDWEKFFKNTVDLYSSDLGMDVTGNYDKQEEIQLQANIGQILTGIVVLKKGGSLVTKQYTIFHSQNLSVIALLTNIFKEVIICKPITSRPFNSEIYLVCKGYLGPFKENEDGFKIIQEIKNKIKEYNNLSFIKKDCFTKDFLSSIKDVFNKIFYRQIAVIKHELKLFDELEKTNNYKERKKIYKKIEKSRQLVLKKWHSEIKLEKLVKSDI